MRAALLICLFLTTLPFMSCAQQCEIAPILNRPVFKARWTGEKIEGCPTGYGILYEFRRTLRYVGSMRDGRPEGFGTHYGDYIIEGSWHEGKPTTVQHYLRQVDMNEDGFFQFVPSGWRYKVDSISNVDLNPRFYYPFEGLDSSCLSRDTLYMLNRKVRKHDSEFSGTTIFYCGDNHDSGFFSSTIRQYFLIICPGGQMDLIHSAQMKYRRGGSSSITWYIGDRELNNPSVYSDFATALHALCGIEKK